MLPFRESGSTNAPLTFVLLHFFGGSHREWKRVAESLAQQHRLVAADMPGFGEAAALEGFSVAEMTAHARELVEYFAPKPVVLVGHSMTGKVAMIVAADPPANLRGVVLVGPSPLAGEPMSDHARAEMRVANTSRARAEKFTRAGFAEQPDDATFETAVEDVLQSSDAAFHAWADVGTREDWSGRVTKLQVPALLIVGEKDKAIAPDLQREQTLPLVEAAGGRMELLPDAAHLLPYEVPDQLATLLAAFAAQVA